MAHPDRLSRIAAAVILFGSVSFAQGTQGVVVEVPNADAPSVVVVGSEERVAYLGVQVEEETDHPEGGARITQVVEGSPAEVSGLQVGDIVIEFAGTTVRGPVGLTKQIHAKSAGDRVTVKVLRDGLERQLEAELGDRAQRPYVYSYSLAPREYLQQPPEVDDEVRERIERGLSRLELPRVWGLGKCAEGEDCGFRVLWGGRPRLGIELVETTPELKRHLGSADESGVLVGKVLRGMPAEHAGVRVGDLIVRVGDERVSDVAELRSALADRAGETFEIRVIRDKKTLDIEVTLPADDEEAILGPQAWLRKAPPAPPAVPVPPRLPPRQESAPSPPEAPAAPGPGRPPAPPLAPRAETFATDV